MLALTLQLKIVCLKISIPFLNYLMYFINTPGSLLSYHNILVRIYCYYFYVHLKTYKILLNMTLAYAQ